jgi:hypothetical protein
MRQTVTGPPYGRPDGLRIRLHDLRLHWCDNKLRQGDPIIGR